METRGITPGCDTPYCKEREVISSVSIVRWVDPPAPPSPGTSRLIGPHGGGQGAIGIGIGTP